MADIIQLGIRIDTQTVQQAQVQLDSLARKLEEADSRVTRIQSSFGELDNRLRQNPLNNTTQNVERLRVTNDQLGNSIREVSNGLNGFNRANNDTTNATKRTTDGLNGARAANDNFARGLDQTDDQLRQVDRQLDRTARTTREWGTHLESVGELGSRAIAGIAAAASVLGLGFGFGALIREAMEAEQELKALDNALRLTEQTGSGVRQAIIDLGDEMEKTTVHAGGMVTQVAAVLTVFGRVSGESLPRATRAVLDFATVAGKDGVSAAYLLARALANPAQAASTLREAGKGLTRDQEEMLNAAVKAGDGLKAQGVILDAIEHRFHGASAATNTLSDSFTVFQNRARSLMEQLGGRGTGALMGVVQSLTQGIEYLSNNLKVAEGVIAGLTVGTVLAGIGVAAATVTALIGGPLALAIAGAAVAIGGLTGVLIANRDTAIQWGDQLYTIAETLQAGWETAVEVITTVLSALRDTVAGIVGEWVENIRFFTQATIDLLSAWTAVVVEIFSTLLAPITLIFGGLADEIKERFNILPGEAFDPAYWLSVIIATMSKAGAVFRSLLQDLFITPMVELANLLIGILTLDPGKIMSALSTIFDSVKNSFDNAGEAAKAAWAAHMGGIDPITGQMVERQKNIIDRLREIDFGGSMQARLDSLAQDRVSREWEQRQLARLPKTPPSIPKATQFDPRPIKTGGADQGDNLIQRLKSELEAATNLEAHYRNSTGTTEERRRALERFRIEQEAANKIAQLDKDLTASQREEAVKLIGAIKERTLAIREQERALEHKARVEQTAFDIEQAQRRLSWMEGQGDSHGVITEHATGLQEMVRAAQSLRGDFLGQMDRPDAGRDRLEDLKYYEIGDTTNAENVLNFLKQIPLLEREINDELAIQRQLRQEGWDDQSDEYSERLGQLRVEKQYNHEIADQQQRLKDIGTVAQAMRENEIRDQILQQLDGQVRDVSAIEKLERQIAVSRSMAASGIAQSSEEYQKLFEVLTAGMEKEDEIRKRSQEGPLEAYIRSFDEIQDINKQIQETTVGMLSGLEDQFVQFAQTGKFSFKEMADAIIADLMRIVVRQMIIMPLLQMMGMAPANALSGFGLFSGGVTKAARGEVVTSPTVRAAGQQLIEAGEGSRPEGILPLHRGAGGDLGVKLYGSGGQDTYETNINVNVNMPQGASPEDGRRWGREVGREIQQTIDSRLIAAKRPRGINNPAMLSG